MILILKNYFKIDSSVSQSVSFNSRLKQRLLRPDKEARMQECYWLMQSYQSVRLLAIYVDILRTSSAFTEQVYFSRSNVLHVREVLEGSLSPPVRLLLKRPADPHASRLLAESTNTKGATPCTSVRVIANLQGIASLEVRDYDVEYLLQPNRSS